MSRESRAEFSDRDRFPGLGARTIVMKLEIKKGWGIAILIMTYDRDPVSWMSRESEGQLWGQLEMM